MQLLRRSFAVALVTIATIAGVLAFAPQTASAAGPWFVAPTTAVPPGNNANSCLTAALPCATVTGVLAKGGFVSGDTINVAPGTYVDHPVLGAKGANIVGTGAGVIFDGSTTTWAIAVNGAAPSNSLTNVTLTRGAFAGGGALPVVTGVVTLNNVNITNSKGARGAAAAVYGNATLNVNGGSFTGNTSTATATLFGAGGAIYVVGKAGATAAGTLNVDGTTFSTNVATGASFVAAGNGGAIFNAGIANIKNATFTSNQAVAGSPTSSARRGQGGSIFNGPDDADDAPILTVTGSSFSGGTVTGGFNSSSGGAIANDETFLGIGGTAGQMTVTTSTFTSNVAIVGGAVYNGGKADLVGGAMTSNAAFSGGAYYQEPLVTPGTAGTTTITGTAFNTNAAAGLSLANFGNGGAIFNGNGTLTVKGGASFTGNAVTASSAASTVTGWGGAIYNGPFAANDAPVASLTDVTIDAGASTANAVIGGGVANVANVLGASGAVPGKLDVLRTSFNKLSAAAGGGIYTGGPTTVTDSTFTLNKATHASVGYGGGLYVSRTPATSPSPSVLVDNTDFTGNTAQVAGGGLAGLNGTNLDVRNGSTVTAGGSGLIGAGLFSSGALIVRDSQVAGNGAGYQGGGIYSGPLAVGDATSLQLVNASITGNSAASIAGGVLTAGGLTAIGGEISTNSAVGAGGVFVSDNTAASFDSTDFVGNTATGLGGGAIFNSGTATVNHARIDGNHALHTTGTTGLGAAVYSGSANDNVNVKLTLKNSTLSNNDAYAAAALLQFSNGATSTNVASIDNTTIHGNSTTTNVGSIEQFHPLSITNSTITDNTAAAGGAGALYLFAPASVSVSGTILSGNTAATCSGAPVDGGYNLADAGDATCGFTAAKHDVSGAPQLGALANNGGDTPTRLPGATSPALNQIPASTATGVNDAVTGTPVVLCGAGATDQRGTARPQGAKCDIGAVEAAQVAPVVTGPNPIDLAVGNGVGTPGPTFTTAAATTPQATLSFTGTLPTGVTFHDNGDGTASLQGTPGANTGGNYPITVKATNEAGTGTFDTVVVVHQAPILGGPVSDTYTVGQPGGPEQFHMTSGHPAATLSTSSPLPSGVTFTPGPGGTATIQGTPDVGTGGVYVITINGTNGTPPDATFVFTLTVREAPVFTATVANDVATVGSAHASAEYVTKATPAATLSATGLPAGLSLTSSGAGKAKITGTPANGTGGEYDITITATNGVSPDAQTVTHLVVNEAPELTGPTNARLVATFAGNVAYSADGYPGAAISAAGPIPSGLTFHDNGNGTAQISGTPDLGTDGTYAITITAHNGIDPDAVVHLTLVIAPPLTITTTSLPNAPVGTPYGASVVAAGGLPPYVFTLDSGTLPAGLSLAADGSISGTPTGPTGTASFVVRVTDSADPAQTFTKPLSITVVKGNTTLSVEPVLLNLSTGPLGLQVYLGLVKAKLTGGSPAQPIAGQTIVWTVNGAPVCSAVTDATGTASCLMNLGNTLLAVLSGNITGTYAGNALWNGSTGSNGLATIT